LSNTKLEYIVTLQRYKAVFSIQACDASFLISVEMRKRFLESLKYEKAVGKAYFFSFSYWQESPTNLIQQ
jgi:hypothetical protein